MQSVFEHIWAGRAEVVNENIRLQHRCVEAPRVNRPTHHKLSLCFMPPKLLACIGFFCKVVLKIGRLRKFNRSREIEFNFLSAWTISMKFGPLVHSWLQTVASDFLIFVQGLSYGLSKSKKRGKIITKL